jgi:hypothetical protein
MMNPNIKKMRILCAMVIPFLLLFCNPDNASSADVGTVISKNPRAGAKILHVALEGNDGNPGTLIRPYRTIQHAARLAKAGDTVLIREGFYRIHHPIRTANSGKPGAWIRYAGYPGERVVIDARDIPVGPPHGTPPYPHDQGAFQIQDVGYIRVEGLTVQNARSAGFAIRDSHHVDLYHNRTNKTFSSGIAVWDTQNDGKGTNHIRVMGNHVTGANTWDLLPVGMRRQKETPHEAISVGGAHEFQVAYNHVHNCFKEGIDIKGTSSNGIVHHNHIHHVKRQGLYVDSWFGTLEDIEIYDNRVHHCGGAGMVISVENGKQVRNVNIFNNMIYLNSGSGLFFSRWGDGPRRYIQIRDNTFYKNGCGKPNPENSYHWITGGLYLYSSNLEHITISNNIFSENCGFQVGVSDRYAASKEDIELALKEKGIVISDNVIHQIPLIDYPIRVGWPPNNYADVFAVPGSRSIKTNPHFVSPEEGDFQLMQSSGATDRGAGVNNSDPGFQWE